MRQSADVEPCPWKAPVALAAVNGDQTIAELASQFAFTPIRSITGRSSCWTGPRVFFEGGGLAEGAASEAQVGVLYRQIGQLKVENDLYEGLNVKRDVVPVRAAMTTA